MRGHIFATFEQPFFTFELKASLTKQKTKLENLPSKEVFCDLNLVKINWYIISTYFCPIYFRQKERLEAKMLRFFLCRPLVFFGAAAFLENWLPQSSLATCPIHMLLASYAQAF